MSQPTRPQQGKSEEKQKEDRGLFLQLPFILIDTVNMSDSAMVGFIRFCREYLQKDKTINYHGSYRLLAKDIKQARMTCYRSVEHWVKSGLITMTETPDEFILTGNLATLWEKNPAYCKAQQRPKIKQPSASTASQNNLNHVPNLNATIPNRDENGKIWDGSEHETGDIDTLDTSIDTFLHARESENDQPGQSTTAEEKNSKQPSMSYSQDIPQTDEANNETHSHFGGFMSSLIEETEATLTALEQQLFVVSPAPWLQENTEPTIDTPSQGKHPEQHKTEVTQASMFGEQEESAPPTPQRPRVSLDTKPDMPEFKQKTATQIARERKEIERHIWKLLDGAAGAKIGRAFTAPMADLVTGLMDGDYADEDFVFSVQDLKARRQNLTFSNIVNNMADAVNKRKTGQQPGKIIPFQQQTPQQHKSSPTGYVLTEEQMQQKRDNEDLEMERRRQRIADRKAKEAVTA